MCSSDLLRMSSNYRWEELVDSAELVQAAMLFQSRVLTREYGRLFVNAGQQLLRYSELIPSSMKEVENDPQKFNSANVRVGAVLRRLQHDVARLDKERDRMMAHGMKALRRIAMMKCEE